MQAFIIIFLFICLVLLIWIIRIGIARHKEKKWKVDPLEIKAAYYEAIEEGDRDLAIRLGRYYYSMKRNKGLTPNIEEAITNDLSGTK